MTREPLRRRRRTRMRRVSVVVQAMTMMTTTTPMTSSPFPLNSPATPSPLRLDDAAPSSADASVGTTAEEQRESSTHSDGTSTSRFFEHCLTQPTTHPVGKHCFVVTGSLSRSASQQHSANSKHASHEDSVMQASRRGGVAGVGAGVGGREREAGGGVGFSVGDSVGGGGEVAVAVGVDVRNVGGDVGLAGGGEGGGKGTKVGGIVVVVVDST